MTFATMSLPDDQQNIQPDTDGATQKTVGKVILGMSGGVDSSVAAWLLLQEGYTVEGLFMKNWEEDDGTEYCTAMEDLHDAQKVCEKLGIKLHTANFAAEYWDCVFAEFLSEYRAHRTPNPDVLCNREIKFKQFAKYAQALGGDYIATGHYAKIHSDDTGVHLCKAVDANKDQTYFLQAVPPRHLKNVLFPLATWHKNDVRKCAEKLGLDNHARKDSTGICFIGERRFADFLARYISDSPGDIVDEFGRKLGAHRGLHQFTLGQRQGLQLGGIKGRDEAPWYVVGKIPSQKQLVVSQRTNLLASNWLRANQPNWLQQVSLPCQAQAKIRYRQSDQPCRLSWAANGELLITFIQPQRAITPGQYVALYQDNELIAGALIQATDATVLSQLQTPNVDNVCTN